MDSVRKRFYKDLVSNFIPDKNTSILICGAGIFDKIVFEQSGFANVMISNLDTRMDGSKYLPFQWAYEDAQALSFQNESFDYTVIHAAVHHSSSPHRVLTEMYRVAKKGVIVIESRDSLIMRLLERLGLTQVYEHAAVYYNDGKFGGVNNTEIPNFVYRWTEREIEKTINTYAPYAKHTFKYRYATSFPVTPELEKNGTSKYLLLKILQPFFWLFTKLFPRQQNLFAFYIQKPHLPEDLFPWIKMNEKGELVFNTDWANRHYKKLSYSKAQE